MAERVLPIVYDELRSIAHRYFRRERRGHTLQATAVVHEAYVQLLRQPDIVWKDRGHLIGVLAHMMRRVLVDYTRQRSAMKRGASDRTVALVDAGAVSAEQRPDLIALDDALLELEAHDPDKAAIVELRFFGGLTIDEVSAYLDLPAAEVAREWRRAKSWLLLALSG